MLCHSLSPLLTYSHVDGRPKSHYQIAEQLRKGASLEDCRIRPDMERPNGHGLFYHRLGKDCSIDDMLRGGNGFPGATRQISHGQISDLHFDLGCTQEKRDLRSLAYWSMSLENCQREQGSMRND